MRKTYFFLFFIILVAVGLSGCLGGDSSNDTNETGNTSENETNESVPDIPETVPPENSSDAEIITSFDGSVVTLSPLPEGFKHIATRTVISNAQNIGISDALIGYRSMYLFEESNVYLSVYKCNLSKTANDYVTEMTNAHALKYGDDSNVSMVQINGHDAVLLTSTVQDTPLEGRYILIWSNWSGDEYDDSYLIVVNGMVNYSTILTVADVSDL